MNKKIILWFIVGVVIALALLYYGVGNVSADPIGKEIELAVYGDKGIIYLPFVKDLSEAETVTIQFGDQTLAENVSIKPRGKWRSGIPVSLPSVPTIGSELSIMLGEKSFTRSVTKVTEEATDLIELAKVTKPEESMKGWGGVAYAESEPATEASRYGMPDIQQRIAECAPTAAANSLISLADEHGAEVPGDEALIDELKGDMDWTPENGVLPPDFVEGKNKWAARHGLPIRTEMVGDQHGRGTLAGILDAMSQGNAAAEIRLKFADASGKVEGGHMVTVTGVRVEGDQTFIDVNDPRTPEGTDTYEVDGNVIKGYPRQGLAILSWGFVQHWEGTPTGTDFQPMTNEEIRGIQNAVGVKEKIKVIIYGSHKIPLSEVHVAGKDKCDAPHYHANNGVATDIEGVKVPDPNATGNSCGYGKVQNVKVEEVELSFQEVKPSGEATPKSGGGAKICGGIFGPCDEK